MAGVQLYDYQLDAIRKMKNGCILCGGVGSGKSLTALGYYYLQNGGDISTLNGGEYIPMDDAAIKDLYIITTARKRDTKEWEGELSPFLLSAERSELYNNLVVIDSWNNIGKYKDVKNAFFIFDEQRVVGSGAWVKSFLKIAASNQWILLSATPGDTWQDYIPVFIANGFFKNRTQFAREHIIYNPRVKFPKIDRYINTRRLTRLRESILINMDFNRPTVSHHEDVFVGYDISLYKEILRKRWNVWEDKPLNSGSDVCYALRRVVNTDKTRAKALIDILSTHPRAIVFYNFDCELDILRSLPYCDGTVVAEWNGSKHQPIPDNDRWVYLVQYTAGCEGWNCIKTDTMIFWSQNYSYKVMTQAAGRTDRLNTPYTDLWYYHLKSKSGIDIAISRALEDKKQFNEGRFIRELNPK